MRLLYSNASKSELIGYSDVGYFADLHKARSQIGYLFINGGTTVSSRSMKQKIVATSSNHAEIIAFMKPVESVYG